MEQNTDFNDTGRSVSIPIKGMTEYIQSLFDLFPKTIHAVDVLGNKIACCKKIIQDLVQNWNDFKKGCGIVGFDTSIDFSKTDDILKIGGSLKEAFSNTIFISTECGINPQESLIWPRILKIIIDSGFLN